MDTKLTLREYDTNERSLSWFRGGLAIERSEYGLAFNPFGRCFRESPNAVYKELREQSPVHFSELLDCWIVTRYSDVDSVLRASAVFRSDPRSSTQQLIDPYSLLDPNSPSLFMLDPPDHFRLRGIIQSALGRSRIQQMIPHLDECIYQVVQDLGNPGDRVELIPKLAQVVPLRAIELITGIEIERLGIVSHWVSKIAAAMDPLATTASASAALESYRSLQAYLAGKRLGSFAENTLCWSLGQAVRARKLSDTEARQLLFFFVLAGTKTVTDFLAQAAHYLVALPLDSPQRHCISYEFIDHLLRVFSPVQMVARTAATSTTIAGQKIQAGQRVLLILASANYDLMDARARAAKSCPQLPRDVVFGQGIHTCPGGYIARVQAQLALSHLMKVYPGVQLVEAKRSFRGIAFRSWETIRVRL